MHLGSQKDSSVDGADNGKSNDSTGSDPGRGQVKRLRRSRLPPPIPPPPYFFDDMEEPQMKMSPDVSSCSASMHEVQIENHL